ncbi:MAG TPA: 3-deoxy-D-manno-octulosonic acid kinase [Woeseiaceae bacterium]|nr:3-deoxy-D-manno-octulosonic acid kinase [Woeseiaceae bacterium]
MATAETSLRGACLEATVQKTETGAILYDRAILNHISDASFTPGGWPSARPVPGRLRSAGRGNTLVVSDGERELVLRHYVRGGLPGRFIHDRYLWVGESRNRAFAEWRLLARLTEMQLPVPRPAAARYSRRGIFYTADLLTVSEPGIEPLSARIARPTDADFWRGIGRGIRRFHDAGVFHADLNAYNVQVNGSGEVFLLDFDRGGLRGAGSWCQQNLGRLHRSLRKVKQLDPSLHFREADWNAMVEGWQPVGA